MTKLLIHLTSTIQAILPPKLQCRYLQREQIKTFQLKNSYQITLTLGSLALEKLQWWINSLSLSTGRSLIQPATTLNDYSHRYIKNSLGSFCQWPRNRWCLDQYGKDSTHQYSGTDSNLFGLFDFHKRNKKCNGSPLDKQCTCPDICLEDGKNSEFRNDKDFQRNLDVFVDLYSRPGVSAKDRFFRMEAESKDFGKNMLQRSITRNRLICIKTAPTVKKIYFLVTRSFQSKSRCHRLVKESGVCFPSILNNTQSAEKGPEGSSENNSFNCTNFEETRLSKQLPFLISWNKDLLKSPLDQSHPLVQNKTRH